MKAKEYLVQAKEYIMQIKRDIKRLECVLDHIDDRYVTTTLSIEPLKEHARQMQIEILTMEADLDVESDSE